MADEDAPLPSESTEEAADEDESSESESADSAAPPRPAAPQFKFSTFLLTFLFVLGIWMLFDQQTRNGVANVIGILLQPIAFHDSQLLLTMLIAGALEMLLTAVAYNYTTDWVKAAKVQSWSAAFRKVQMNALRSGKKDRIAALQPHQQKLTQLSSEVSIAQLKGMAVTWFLVIAIYTWVGIQIGQATIAAQTINFGGASASLAGHAGPVPIPLWFVIFSLYTIPYSFLFRRVLKHYWLRRYAQSQPASAAAATGAA